MDAGSTALQVALLNGLRQPLLEISELSEATIEGWLGYRLWAIGEPDSSCMVGHTDLLALPV